MKLKLTITALLTSALTSMAIANTATTAEASGQNTPTGGESLDAGTSEVVPTEPTSGTALVTAEPIPVSQRRFDYGFGLERTGTSLLDIFSEEEPSGVSPFAEAKYGDPYGLDFAIRASVNLWTDSIEDFPLEESDIGIATRSDIRLYRQDRFTLDRLYASYSFRAGENFFGRVTAGLLQTQYSGAIAEVLYAPENTPFAIGAEIAQAKKRDPNEVFGTLDADAVTSGFVTAYYDTGYPGFLLSAAYGQFLAEDQGTTLTIAKRFNGGWELKGEITATDYYFDNRDSDYLVPKVTLYIPLKPLSRLGLEGRYAFDKFVSSDTDAGRKLILSGSIYEDVRGYEAEGYSKRWGGF